MTGRKTALCLTILRKFGSREVSVVLNESFLEIAIVLREHFGSFGGARGGRDFSIDTHDGSFQGNPEYVGAELVEIDLRL
jgi:hypothetical protein